MTKKVFFDDIWPSVRNILAQSELAVEGIKQLWVIRDLLGRVRLALAEEDEAELSDRIHEALRKCAQELQQVLGAHAYDPSQAILLLSRAALEKQGEQSGILKYSIGGMDVYLVDRTIIGNEWSAAPAAFHLAKPLRFSFFSIKGGVGRSTTAAVLAQHLANQGKRVLVVDLDLEAPGLAAALLDPDEYPRWGVVDWFIEDLVGQGDEVVRDMVARPRWGQDMLGDIMVVPAYTLHSEEYIAKLGRVYLDRPAFHLGERPQRWTERLQRFLDTLEKQEQPDVVLLDSRSGLHDIAAALVTELGAHVLLFAADTEATWMGYRVLFRHWHTYGTARRMRNRLSMVAALVPPRRPYYLDHFREAAWDLFRDTLYDEVEDETDPAGEDLFSFDLMDDNAPHLPIPIYWNEGLAAVSSLQNVDKSVVGYAYQRFLRWFDDWMAQFEGAKP